MELAEILKQVDVLLEENKGAEAEDLMKRSILQAVQDEDDSALLSLVNELMGYYRETSQVEASYEMAEQARKLSEKMGLEGTIPYATTLLNIANAYRAGGRLQDSMECYQETMKLYQTLLPADDMLVASLHNNISLLYQEMGDFKAAREHLLSALAIVEKKTDQEVSFELAVTYANLAATCLQIDEDEEAAGHARKAIEIFEAHGVGDAHYSAALASLGTYHYKKGDYQRAASCFRRAMECVRRSLGENEHYRRLEASLQECEKKMRKAGEVSPSSRKGLELCRAYFEACGKPMIHEKFPDYEGRIAAGLVGEGSDCFGFDDEVSRDHDWGPGFCLWVTQKTWEEIGPQLQEAYEQLPAEFEGCCWKGTPYGKGRRGVQRIGDFYGRFLGKETGETLEKQFSGGTEPENAEKQSEKTTGKRGGEPEGNWLESVQWDQVSDSALAAAVNGEVFCDPEQIFSRIRARLQQGYPQRIQFLKLAESAARFSQTGQYNYSRMLGRGDRVTAEFMFSDCLKEALKLCYYMENQYPPHDKWLLKGLAEMDSCREITDLIRDIVDVAAAEKPVQKAAAGKTPQEEAPGQTIAERFELLGGLLADKLYEKGAISDRESYLDAHTEELLTKAHFAGKKDEELVWDIARMEFQAFDKVRNVGGRAECQDDWYTFQTMRRSQYMTWNRTMLLQYLYDFEHELAGGRNLITEKYGRMMESTAPGEYEELKKYFPVLDAEKQGIVDAIVRIQVGWMEEFAAHYPTLADNARSVHSSEDNLYNTSYETYLRGEISTYSDKLLELYGRYVVNYAQEGKNLAYEIMTNCVKLYGYRTLQEAEEQMSRLQGRD